MIQIIIDPKYYLVNNVYSKTIKYFIFIAILLLVIKMKREGIHGLIQYLNKTTNNATNTQVAKAIFTNRDKINENQS